MGRVACPGQVRGCLRRGFWFRAKRAKGESGDKHKKPQARGYSGICTSCTHPVYGQDGNHHSGTSPYAARKFAAGSVSFDKNRHISKRKTVQKDSHSLRAQSWTELLGEFCTGIGGPDASSERLRLVAWVRMLGFLPLIWLPTLVEVYSLGDDVRDPAATQTLQILWAAHLGIWLLSNTAILISNGRNPALERILTFICLFAEIGSNHLILHALGTLSYAGIVNIMAIAVGYRVFVDFRAGAFAIAVGITLLVSTVVMELSGLLTIAPAIASTEVPAVYLEAGTATSALIATTTSIFIVFLAVNYGVNQALKLHRYITYSVLRRYLPSQLVERASEGQLSLDAPPERRVVTVMFTDLVGFTSLSEQIGPEAIGDLLNNYLTEMSVIADKYEATIDKFIGDCIMIVFGAPEPLSEKEQAQRCVALANELHAAVPKISGANLQARTGINTGEAVVGNFGSQVKSDYTVLGSTVNLASRLESASRPGKILISARTANLLAGSGIELEPAGTLTLKGVSEPVEAFFVVNTGSHRLRRSL